MLLAVAGTWLAGVSLPVFGQMGMVSVEVAPVVEEEVAKTVTLVGTVGPNLRTTVAAEVAGFVSELPVDMGDRVERGGLLCRLRDVTRRQAVEEARAELKRLEAAHRESQAMREKWEFEFRRMEGLWRKGQCSEKEYRDTVTEHAGAVARSEAAAHAVAAQAAVVERVSDDLGRMEIRAPFAGLVVAKRTEMGQWLEPGGPVAEIVALDTVRVRVNVPESAIQYVSVGAPVRVFLDALGEAFEGRLGRMSPEGDERARTFPVEIDLRNTEGRFRAGMFARADVPAGPRKQRLIVPKDAVVRREGAVLIFAVREHEGRLSAEPIAVRVLAELADRFAIAAPGLEAGDRVVVRGNERMFGPTPVALAPPSGRPTTAPGASTAGDSGARR